MESYNKTKLNDTQLENIIDKAFSQSIQSVKELSDGWANVAYVVQLNDGRKVVLKVTPSQDKQVMRGEKNNMQTELEAIRMVANIGECSGATYIYIRS